MSVWRAAGAILAFYVVTLLIAGGLFLLEPGAWAQASPLAAQSIPVLAAAVIVTAVALRVTGMPLAEMGGREAGRAWRGFGIGAALGVGMAAVAIALAVVVGGATLRFGAGAGGAGAAFFGTIVTLLMAALAEELLFRGFPLTFLARASGRLPAILALVLVFALVHVRGAGATPLALGNIALAGLVLSAAFFGPGGLPLAWGLHTGWNVGLGLLFGAPVSGLALDGAVSAYRGAGMVSMTGGAFGPEGGLVATAVMAAVALIWGRRWLAWTENDA